MLFTNVRTMISGNTKSLNCVGNNGSCKQWLKMLLGNATQVQLFTLYNITTSQTLIILFREVEIESIPAVVRRKREANKQFVNAFYLS